MTQDIIDEAVQRLVAAAQPNKIILFGSHTRGEAHERSDLDFLVIEGSLTKQRMEAVRLQDVLRPMRIPVDIIVTSEKTFQAWQDTPNTVYFDASREAKICYEKP